MPEKDHGAPVTGQFGFDHVSFGVATEEDLWELKEKLEAADFWVSEVVDHGFIHSIYTFDPNNIPVEFSHSIRSADIRRNPILWDSKPTDIAREGAEARVDKWPAVKNPTPAGKRTVYPGAGSELFQGINRDED